MKPSDRLFGSRGRFGDLQGNRSRYGQHREQRGMIRHHRRSRSRLRYFRFHGLRHSLPFRHDSGRAHERRSGIAALRRGSSQGPQFHYQRPHIRKDANRDSREHFTLNGQYRPAVPKRRQDLRRCRTLKQGRESMRHHDRRSRSPVRQHYRNRRSMIPHPRRTIRQSCGSRRRNALAPCFHE